MKISGKVLVCFSLFCSFAHAEKFKLGDKTIKANISLQHLNRISVKNDRIDSILGLDNAFHYEKNEKTGDVFIRPTEENGYGDIGLTVVTTSGKSQDLLLTVVDGSANTIELEGEPTADLSQLGIGNPDEGSSGNDYEENVSAVMKKFILYADKLPKLEVLSVADRSYGHIKTEFQSAHRVDGFLCLKYKISTEKQGVFRLDERMFSRSGDVALSLSELAIGKNSQATLFIVRTSFQLDRAT